MLKVLKLVGSVLMDGVLDVVQQIPDHILFDRGTGRLKCRKCGQKTPELYGPMKKCAMRPIREGFLKQHVH